MAKAALFSGLRGLARDLYTFAGCRSRAHDTPADGPEDVHSVSHESRDGLRTPEPLCNTGSVTSLPQLNSG